MFGDVIWATTTETATAAAAAAGLILLLFSTLFPAFPVFICFYVHFSDLGGCTDRWRSRLDVVLICFPLSHIIAGRSKMTRRIVQRLHNFFSGCTLQVVSQNLQVKYLMIPVKRLLVHICCRNSFPCEQDSSVS